MDRGRRSWIERRSLRASELLELLVGWEWSGVWGRLCLARGAGEGGWGYRDAMLGCAMRAVRANCIPSRPSTCSPHPFPGRRRPVVPAL